MPNIAVSVAATGLPSRRLALATLAGLGTALALPKAVHASTSADAVVFAQVAEYKRLWEARRQADVHFDALCARVDAEVGPKPVLKKADVFRAELKALRLVPDASREVLDFLHDTFALAMAEHGDAVEAWTDRLAASRAKHRHRVADRRLGRFEEREKRALDAVTALRPVTLAGIIAKSGAFEQSDAVATGDHTDLAASVLRDLSAMGATIGGAA